MDDCSLFVATGHSDNKSVSYLMAVCRASKGSRCLRLPTLGSLVRPLPAMLSDNGLPDWPVISLILTLIGGSVISTSYN